jgi:hypothetical protein
VFEFSAWIGERTPLLSPQIIRPNCSIYAVLHLAEQHRSNQEFPNPFQVGTVLQQ